jgi:hypothetical protein
MPERASIAAIHIYFNWRRNGVIVEGEGAVEGVERNDNNIETYKLREGL